MPNSILVSCMSSGDGVTQDYEKAVQWYQKAADQGHAEAQYNIGVAVSTMAVTACDARLKQKRFKWFAKSC